MLMRVSIESVDYSHVQENHADMHMRLEKWARWVRVTPNAWPISPMFRMFQSKARQWDMPTIKDPVNTLDALLVERGVAKLPAKHRDAVRWSYVFQGNPVGMARRLAVTKQGLADLVNDGRTMLINRKL